MGLIARGVIALILGVLVAIVASWFVPDVSKNGELFAKLLGLLVGLGFFFGYGPTENRWKW